MWGCLKGRANATGYLPSPKQVLNKVRLRVKTLFETAIKVLTKSGSNLVSNKTLKGDKGGGRDNVDA